MKQHRDSLRTKARVAVLTALMVMFLASPVQAASLHAKSAIAMDLSTGRILYEQNADEAIPPASLTKVLTLYLAYEAMQENRLSYTDTVLVSREATQAGGSRMSLKAGERVIVRELMKGIAVASGNDACVALAQHLSGGESVQPFVDAMNRKAHELGMTGTTFKNPNGMPAEGQVTTARDMLKLSASYLRRFPQSLTFHSMTSYVHNNHNHHNANRLLNSYDGVDGLKTGYIRASGYNNVVTAKRGEQRIVAVVLGARSPGTRAVVSSQLLNMAFAKLSEPGGHNLAVLEEKRGKGVLPASLASRAPVQPAQADEAPAKSSKTAQPVQVASADLKAAQRLADAKAAQLADADGKADTPAANLVERKGQGGYAIQESSFQSRQKAEKRAKTLVKRGLPVKVVTARLGKDKYYRVLVGPYANAETARKTRDQLLGQGSVTVE